jgi:hypothetical protein
MSSYLVPGIIFLVSIFILAQSAMAIQKARKDGTAKTSGYGFNGFMLAGSLVAMLGSGFMVYKARKAAGATNLPNGAVNTAASSAAGSATNIEDQQKSLSNILRAKANKATHVAGTSSKGAELANQLANTLGNLKNNKAL